jgi:hypothetical protein
VFRRKLKFDVKTYNLEETALNGIVVRFKKIALKFFFFILEVITQPWIIRIQ